jgi:AraC family transcriptional regulator
MQKTKVTKDQKKRIESVQDFIFKNLTNDIPLKKLAEVANYSPFHFQKLFKLFIGESPKQYIMKLRIEASAHLIMVHAHRSIMEIAMDCGFSSPSVFSRSFKNHFGISPEEIRTADPEKKSQIHKKRNPNFPMPRPSFENTFSGKKKLDIQIQKLASMSGIYLFAPFNDTKKIQETFYELKKLAFAHDIACDPSHMWGILSPHQGNIYKAFLAISDSVLPPKKLKNAQIKADKYLSFKVKGGIATTIEAGQHVFTQWLPNSGYKIGEICAFERFSSDPSLKSYEKLEREIFIPVEPV